MTKKKYESTDNRTGYSEGEIVELSDEELNALPFNVNLTLMEPVDDKKKVEEAAVAEDAEALRFELTSKGLSPKRVAAVVEKYGDLESLTKKASKAGIDKLTDEFLAKEYGKGKKEAVEDGVQ